MCSHFQALQDRERHRRHFGVELPPEPGKADMWPGYVGSFIRRHLSPDHLAETRKLNPLAALNLG